jgi:hypothetical protein
LIVKWLGPLTGSMGPEVTKQKETVTLLIRNVTWAVEWA